MKYQYFQDGLEAYRCRRYARGCDYNRYDSRCYLRPASDVTCARHLAGEAPAACLATEGTGGREIIVEFVVQNEP